MLWWSHWVVNIRLLGIECLIQRTENKLSWAKMLDIRTCYKNRLYFPLPHHLFLHKTRAACPYLPPTILFCCRFLPWFWFTFPLTHHLFFNSLVRSEVKMRNKTSKLTQTGSLSLPYFPWDHRMSRFMCSEKKLHQLTQRWSDSRGPDYTSQTQEMDQYTRIPIHSFILHFSCQAISFQLVIAFLEREETQKAK